MVILPFTKIAGPSNIGSLLRQDCFQRLQDLRSDDSRYAMAQRVLLYEFITGGGMFSFTPDGAPWGSLLREGAAMIAALAADFSVLSDTEVVAFHDGRLTEFKLPAGVNVVEVGSADEESKLLAEHARAADWTVVIAPEFDNLLLQRVRRVEQAGGKLLSPNSATIVCAQDKHLTIRRLEYCGIATPRGERFRSGCSLPQKLSYPAVVKPLDGAGSLGIKWIESPDAEIQLPPGKHFRIEEFCPGVPASVSVLCGPKGHFVLPASHQRLSDDGSFQYLGGSVPLAQDLRARAECMALAVSRAMPLSVGYLGIDMVLAEHGHDRDVVIEVNPRLTTSYVGLRELARCNLAAAMLDVAEGETPDLSFDDGPVEFLADGTMLHG